MVAEAGPLIPARHRQMLLSILDLGQLTVNDIMIPRQEIAGIDVAGQLGGHPRPAAPDAAHAPAGLRGRAGQLVGILHMKRVAQELARGTLTRERLIEIARSREPYFVPEGTSLTVQLTNFQRNRRRLAFVVNEYGDIEGLVTLEDILEEIVGEFTTDPATVTHKDIHRGATGRLHHQRERHDARAESRAAVAAADDGPEDLNGLLLEQLETIPDPGTALKVGPLSVRGAADRGQRHQDRARVRADGLTRPRSACAENAAVERLTHAAGHVDFEPGKRLARRVLARDERLLEALLLRLAQPLLAVGDRTHLAREAELAEGNERARQRLGR